VTSFELALALHVLGVMVLSGGAVAAAVAFESARRRDRPGEVALLLGVARVGALIVLPGALLVLVAGLWLAGEADQFGEAWLQASLALFVVALVLGAIGGGRPKRARLLAARLAGDGDRLTPELRRLLDDPLSRVANYGSSVLLIVILVLMVWQPGR
jgi:uncharacterized membrane protein